MLQQSRYLSNNTGGLKWVKVEEAERAAIIREQTSTTLTVLLIELRAITAVIR